MAIDLDYLSFWNGVGLILLIPLLRTKWWVDITLIPLYLYAVYAAFSPWYISYPSQKLEVVIEGNQHLFIALCLALVLLLKSNLNHDTLRKRLGLFGVINLCNMIIFRIYPIIRALPTERTGSLFVPNVSMCATLNVVLLPYMIYYSPLYWPVFVVATILMIPPSHSSTAYLTAGVSFLSCLYLSTIKRKTKIWIIAVMPLLAALILEEAPGFWYGGERFNNYALFFRDFGLKEFVIGMGPSSFNPWGAVIQADSGIGGSVFLFMHSDPLQFIWEFGLLLLIPVVFSFAILIKKTETIEFLALMPLLASTIFYYPFHLSVFLVVFFLIVKLTYGSVGETSSNGSGRLPALAKPEECNLEPKA